MINIISNSNRLYHFLFSWMFGYPFQLSQTLILYTKDSPQYHDRFLSWVLVIAYIARRVLFSNFSCKKLLSILSFIKCTFIQFFISECKCSLANDNRFWQLIQKIKSFGKTQNCLNPVFLRTCRIIVSEVWILSSLANFKDKTFFPFLKLVTSLLI